MSKKTIKCAYCNKQIEGTYIVSEGYDYHCPCFDKTALWKRITKLYRESADEMRKFKYKCLD